MGGSPSPRPPLPHTHWGEIMGRHIQIKPVGSNFRRDTSGKKHWLAYWSERKHSGNQPRGRRTQSLSANKETKRHQRQTVRGMQSLPCHRQKGSYELSISQSQSTHQMKLRKEKRKPLIVNTEAKKIYWAGSVLQWQTCAWRTGTACGFLQHFSQPSFIHMECLSSSSCLLLPLTLGWGGEEERVLRGSFYSYPGQEATHLDLYSPIQNYILSSENPKTLLL